MLEQVSASPGKDKGHNLVPERILSFPLASFFGMQTFLFYIVVIVCLWQSKSCHGREECRAHARPSIRLRVPSAILRSSLGKNMADAVVTTSFGIQDGTEQMALEHRQTVTSRALVVASSVTTRTLVDHKILL